MQFGVLSCALKTLILPVWALSCSRNSTAFARPLEKIRSPQLDEQMLKKLLVVVGALAVFLICAGLWAVQASNARLAQTWPDVVGEDLPVPYPLSDAEVETLRKELLDAGKDHAGRADTSHGDDGSETMPDPLAGADLSAIALDRAKKRGALVQHSVGLQGMSWSQPGRKACGGRPTGVDLYAPNISKGGLTKDYTTADWDRIIRHGVKPDNTNATMPAIDYMALSDQEISDIIAYATSMPAVDGVQPDTTLGPVGRMLIATGKMPIAAELIDHKATTLDAPPETAINATYGEHIAQPCVGCHRLRFEGGPIAAGPPDWPPAANLTQAGNLKDWSEKDFLTAMRTGVRPDGSNLNPIAMPWPILSQMSDLELRAIWAYISTLEPVATGA